MVMSLGMYVMTAYTRVLKQVGSSMSGVNFGEGDVLYFNIVALTNLFLNAVLWGQPCDIRRGVLLEFKYTPAQSFVAWGCTHKA